MERYHDDHLRTSPFFTGLCRQILHSFSIIRNVKTIMSTDCGKGDLTYLHGIRVLSLFWIILFHVHTVFILSLGPIGKCVFIEIEKIFSKLYYLDLSEKLRGKRRRGANQHLPKI